MRIAWTALLLQILALTLACGATAAQQRVVALAEPGTPVVATELLLAVGPVDEPAGLAGITYLTTRALIAPIRPSLDSLGVHLAITPQKDAISISVIAAPDVWETATADVVAALFADSAVSRSVLDERASIIEELVGRAANPADAATREADRAFFGSDHPWGHPTVGTPGSVGNITVADVDDFLRANFTPDRTFASIVGPVDADAAVRELTTALGSPAAAPVPMVPFAPEDTTLHRDYDSITTWISASFEVPKSVETEIVRFIAYLAADELSFSPSQRSVYNVSSDVVPRMGGGEIRLVLVVPPEEADRWAARLDRVIADVLEDDMPPDVFAGHLRRFYGERAMSLLAPEDRAHAAARQLLVEGRFQGLLPDFAGITQERVRRIAESLGPPTIVLLGPVLKS